MSSKQQRYRNVSSDSMGRERAPSDDGYYQGRLKAMDGRKGTSTVTINNILFQFLIFFLFLRWTKTSVFPRKIFHYIGTLLKKWPKEDFRGHAEA